MKSIFEKLQYYFDNSSTQKIEKDWKSTEIWDQVESVSIDEFLENSTLCFDVNLGPPDLDHKSFVNYIKNPNFTSDFLFQ